MRTVVVPMIVISSLIIGAVFSPPVDNPRVTSTFGEFRALGMRGPHFHMGVDFSTALSEGKPVYAAADGYLVRLEIDTDDIYGYTLVLDHENGYRSLYAHMSSFSPKLKEIVEDLKREFGDQRIVVEFPTKSIYFRKGEIVGFSGKTGEATWPHVHFEVRDESEKISIDPLPLMSEVKRPVDEEIVVEKISVNGRKYTFSNGGIYSFTGDYPKIELLAYSVGNANRLGLKSLTLFLDGEKVYSVVFDEIAWSNFNDVWKVYGKDSVMNEYSFKPWYLLYPNGESNLVKLNLLSKKKFKSGIINARIELVDVWGMMKTLEFKLRKVR